MKSKGILLAGFILCSFLTYGQTETYDILTLTPLAGYSRESGKSGVLFLRQSDDKTAYCKFIVYVSRAGSADTKKEFIDEWTTLIKNVIKPQVVDVPSKTEAAGPDDGWSILSAETVVKASEGDFIIALVSIVGHGRVTSIYIQTNTQEYSADIGKFLGGVKPETKVAEAMALAANQVQNKTTTTNPQNIVVNPAIHQGNSGIVGVWWGLASTTTVGGLTNAAGTGYSSYGTSSHSSLKNIAFFDDGTFCNYLSSDGLADYKQQRAKAPDYWGTYRFENGNGIIQFSAALSYEISLDGEILNYNQDHFYKVTRLDNLKLNGTYTAEKNPSAYVGQEPTISFSPEGRFDDHGAIYWVRHVKGFTEDMQDKMTGSGAYEIYFYTITFKYDDGRLIRMTLLDTNEADKTMPKQIRLGNFALLDRK